MKFAVLLLVVSPIFGSALKAQDRLVGSWEDRVRATTARQPAWAAPVVSPASGLVQQYRFDGVRQIAPARTTTWNINNAKGFYLILFDKAELDIDLPALIEHNNPKVADGAGDFCFDVKYRLFAGTAEHHNYSTAIQLAFTVPTGSYKNGIAVSTVTPSFVAGKGFGKFDVQSSIWLILPTSSVPAIGRTMQWNTAAQYQVAKYFWPELEVNATYFFLGPNDGKNQNFLTPGLVVGKIKLNRDPASRQALILGTGMQIATSTYHAYNHSLVLTSRVAF